MTQLLKDLDTLVFAEISALYYMECAMAPASLVLVPHAKPYSSCSFFRFFVRSLSHSTFLTPKTESSSSPLEPATTAPILSILLPNLICILLHLFASLPTAAENSRGYLHGGILVDFIGQKAPTSRLPLLMLDLAILAIQSLMLAVHLEREMLRRVLRTRSLRSDTVDTEDDGEGGSRAPEVAGLPQSTQDHDSEERGVLRDMPESPQNEQDTELQPLKRRRGDSHREDEPPPRSNGNLSRPRVKIRLSELVSSGNVILGEFHVLHTLRTAATDYESAAAHTVQTIGYNVTMATLLARSRQPASGGPT